MYSTRFTSFGIIFFLIVSSVPFLQDLESDGSGIPVREVEDLLTERSDSDFFPGEMRNEYFEDVTGDGIKDAIIKSRTYPPSQYHLTVLDLTTGSVIYNYTTIYGNLNLKLLDVDDDPALEIVVDDYDHHIQHTRLFVYDVQTSSILFEPPLIDGRYHTDIIEGEFMLKVIDDPASYTPDRVEWWEMYEMSSWTRVWKTPKFVRGSGIYEDIDNDGITEYIYWSNWLDFTPYRGNVYFVDLADHQIKLNSTDVGMLGYGGSDLTRVDSFDLENDGYSEVLIHAFWEHNSTSRSYLYSGRTNSRIWSTENLSEYRLRDNPILEDMDGDGIPEIILLLSAPGTEYDSKLVVLDPQTGDIVLEDEIDHRLYESQIYALDLNEDGNKDLLVFNATDYHDGAMTFRAYDPADSWNKIYTKDIRDMLTYIIHDQNGEGELRVLIVEEGGSPDQIEIISYDPSDMAAGFQFGPFSIGNSGSHQATQYYYYGADDIVSIQIYYRDSSGGNYSQIHICNLSNGEVEYSSPRFSSEVSSSVQITSTHLNNDSITDFFLKGYWEDPINPVQSGRMIFLNGENFSSWWDSGEIVGFNSPQLVNHSIKKLGRFQHLSFDYLDGTETVFNSSLFNTSGNGPVRSFSFESTSYNSLREMDLQLDGEYELEVRWSESGAVYFEYFDFSTGKPVLDDTHEVPGTYGYTGDVHPGPGDGTTFEVWTSDTYRIFRYPEMTEVHFHNWTDYPSREKVDLNQDDSKEFFWSVSEDLGSTGISDLFILDMSTGDVVWELPDVNYSAEIHIEDIDGDEYFELILYKQLDWDDPEMWGMTVFNVTTDLKPELLSPLGPLELVEDGDPGIIELGPLFGNDGPVAFDAIDLSGELIISLDDGTSILTVSPLPDVFGMKEVDIIVSDEKWDVHFILEVNISPVEDAPYIVNISGVSPLNDSIELTAEQEVENIFQIHAEDPDLEEIPFSHSPHPRFNITEDGLLRFLPVPEDGPEIDIEIQVGPSSGLNVNYTLIFQITRKPHPPMDINITSPDNGSISFGTWTFNASALNIDKPWGDLLIFNWSSDVDGFLGNGTPFIHTGLTPGNHTITLNISDSDGFWIMDSIKIEVLSSVEFEDPWEEEATAEPYIELEDIQLEALVLVNGSKIIVRETYYLELDLDQPIEELGIYLKTYHDDDTGGNTILHGVLTSGEGIAFDLSMKNESCTVIYEIEYDPDEPLESIISSLENTTYYFMLVGWTETGLFDLVEASSKLSISITDITDGLPDDDDTDDDDTDDDDEEEDDDDRDLGMIITICAVFLILMVVMIIIALIIIIKKASGRKGEMDWEE
jgi:hypothetical protein